MAEDCPRNPRKVTFRRRHRLSGATEFRAVYCDGCRKSAGPLTLHIRPSGKPEHRLGLSVGRRVGGAVARNRLKRLLREAFRLTRSELPAPHRGGYDIVVSVRPHRALPLVSYQKLLADLVERAHREVGASRPELRDDPA